ncbi:MAG: hypothetical protein AB7F35_14285 [Acetobacteraceae bacterium]
MRTVRTVPVPPQSAEQDIVAEPTCTMPPSCFDLGSLALCLPAGSPGSRIDVAALRREVDALAWDLVFNQLRRHSMADDAETEFPLDTDDPSR